MKKGKMVNNYVNQSNIFWTKSREAFELVNTSGNAPRGLYFLLTTFRSKKAQKIVDGPTDRFLKQIFKSSL